MAKADWLTISPTSGQGNATIHNVATEHTGRVDRTTTVTGVAAGVSPNKTYTVIQYSKDEFVRFDNDSQEVTVDKEGGSLTLKGKSNSVKLTFSLLDNAEGTSNDLSLSLPASYTAAGVETANGVAIAGDPGASAEYEFSITFTDIPENVISNELQCMLRVDANNGTSFSRVTIKQAPGGSTFSFKRDSVLISQAGGEADTSQSVESNTSWELS